MKKTALALTLAALISSPSPAAQADVFISEYIEGSSNNKAIELFNPTAASIDLADYVLEYYFNGSATAGYRITLSGSIAPQSTYVIANSSAVADVLNAAQLVVGGSWYNGDDAIVLKRADTVIDSFGQVGVDPGSYWESSGVRTADRTLRRIDSVLTGDTTVDDSFEPHLQWVSFDRDTFDGLGNHLGYGATPPVPDLEIGACGDPATLISSIQGPADVSPLLGEQVIVEAVVSANFQATDQLRGFFLQQLSAEHDEDALTSEGIFVYHDAHAVTVGDRVRLVADVEEYFAATQLADVVALQICAQDLVIEPTVVSLPMSDATAFEAYEGMLVAFQQQLTVTDNYGLGRYGEFVLATERQMIPTQIAAPGAAAQQVAAANALARITIDDGRTGQNPAIVPYPAPELSAQNSLRVGSEVNGVVGILTYAFSTYRVHPTQPMQFLDQHPRPQMLERHDAATARVASFNVLNYFNGDGQGGGFPTARGADSAEELLRQEAKLVRALLGLDADVIGLIEMENDGFGANSALATLTAALSAAAGVEWTYVDLGTAEVGTDAITSAIIYRTDRISEVGTSAFTTQVPFDYGSRAPVTQSFSHLESGEVFTLAVAHLRSKGSCGSAEGDDRDSGDGQGCWNATRVLAAQTLLQWLAEDPTGTGDHDLLIIGDMNAYSQEDPIQVFKAAGFNDLKTQFLGTHHHSYVFAGESGSLDHAFASPSLRGKVVAVQDWAINADEPLILDYNLEFKSPLQQISFYAEDPYRSSDHDPVLIDLNFQAPVQVPAPTPPVAPPVVTPPVAYEPIQASGQWLPWGFLLLLMMRRRR